jgi:hypothetical protein
MNEIEYYYPLTELTVKIQNENKYFECLQNKQVNFALNENTKGIAQAYYITNIPTDIKTTTKMTFGEMTATEQITATKYLVIQHKYAKKSDSSDTLYVAIPICVVDDKTIHSYKKSNNFGKNSLSESLSMLENASSLTKTVKFSLEHVIASMTNFEPTGYYNATSTTNTRGNKKIIVLNAPLYTTTKFESNFYGDPINFSIENIDLTPIEVKRIYKKSQCNKKTEKVEPKTLFSFSSLKEKTRIDYLNIIYSIGYLMLVMLFYYIYNHQNYGFIIKPFKLIILGVICVSLIIIVLPIELMKKKGDRAALQHGTIFARYTVIASFLILAIMFGKGFIETIKGIRNNGIMSIIVPLLTLMANPYLFFGYIVAIALFILATVFAFL